MKVGDQKAWNPSHPKPLRAGRSPPRCALKPAGEAGPEGEWPKRSQGAADEQWCETDPRGRSEE